jgi:type II secretory pathway component PulK
LLVLVVVAMLTLASLGFAELMLNEHRAAQTASRQSQARAFAQSGAELARQFLDRAATDQQTAGGIYDNSTRFANQLVADDTVPRNRGRFSVIAPRIEDRSVTGIRYGLQDESARINLATILDYDKSSGSGGSSSSNTTAKQMLMGLPGMTDEIADSILDWIDSDDTPREQGAERDYYSTLQPPYAPRNGAPVSIDELLMIRGVTPELLYGLDAARMGLSSGTSDSSSIAGVDNSDGSMDHGWAAYLTLWSAESTVKADGTKKIDLNGKDLKKLYDDLSTAIDQPMAEFIVAFRMGGGAADGGGHLDTSKLGTGKTKIKTMLDLVGASVPLTRPNSQNGQPQSPVQLKSPLSNDSGALNNYLPKLFDNCTVDSGKAAAGRININQAPRVVLMCIPGMTSDVADQIISSRLLDPANPNGRENRSCPAWPLIEGLVDIAKMKSFMSYVTAGGSVYRAQVIGSFDKGSPTSRLEVVFDATKKPTRVLFWRDVSHLNGGFPGENSAEK